MIRSTPLARTGFKTKPKAPGDEAKPAAGPKQRKCCVKACRTPFLPSAPFVTWCGPECAVIVAMQRVAKQNRKDDRARKVALKTRQEWLKEAQAAFNAFVRERDRNEPCISCGRFHAGSYDAGHYRSVGAQPALRFDETNVHKQCVPCNQHNGGNVVEYRIRLIAKIGREAVELLEIEHAPAKYDIDDAKRIKAVYKAKLNALKEQAA